MPDTARIFFALWPDDRVRSAIVSQSQALLQGHKKIVPATNLHLTLAFIGNIASDRLPAFRAAADRIQARPFALTLDCAGTFKRAQVLWLGCSDMADGLQLLVTRLNQALKACDYEADTRPYVPHLTLARKFRKKAPQDVSIHIDWSVDAFSLIESAPVDGGVEYRVLQSWALVGDDL